MSTIRITYQGTLAAMPVLEVGEFGYATDQNRMYIGTSGGNIPTANLSDVGGSGEQARAEAAEAVLQGNINAEAISRGLMR